MDSFKRLVGRRKPMSGPLRGLADSLAGVDTLRRPPAQCLVTTQRGTLELTAIRLSSALRTKSRRWSRTPTTTSSPCSKPSFGRQDVTFEYDTKLTMPVELTLSHLYRRALEKAPPGVNPVAGTRRTDPLLFPPAVRHIPRISRTCHRGSPCGGRGRTGRRRPPRRRHARRHQRRRVRGFPRGFRTRRVRPRPRR